MEPYRLFGASTGMHIAQFCYSHCFHAKLGPFATKFRRPRSALNDHYFVVLWGTLVFDAARPAARIFMPASASLILIVRKFHDCLFMKLKLNETSHYRAYKRLKY